MAELLRRKSKVFVAFGACAATGGIPALANQHGLQHLLDTVFLNAPSVENAARLIPQPICHVTDGELALPAFLPPDR